MYGKYFIVFIGFAIINSVSSTPQQTAPGVRKMRIELRKCFEDVVMSLIDPDTTNRTCNNTEDFIKAAHHHYENVEKTNTNQSRNIGWNEKQIDLMIFILKHKYVKDYILNADCINETSCLNKEIGKIVDLNGSVAYIPRKNILNALFNPSEEPKYNSNTCDITKSYRNCIEKEALSECNNHTAQFMLDCFDHNMKHCEGIESFTLPPRPGGASELVPATFLTTLVLTVLCLSR